ncbi:hypothetical protein [Acetobacter sp.]|uniref:hypothetical protein n=1 Tax=Acetobacter sp. TaxID=440 RepID=UPI0039EAEE55
MGNAENYIVYRTEASGDEGIGYVVNAIMWDGTGSLSPGDGLAIVADAKGDYPIGSIYAAPAS